MLLPMLRLRDLEIATDFPSKKVVDLSMARDRRCAVRFAIYVNGVLTAFPKKLTAMPFQVPNKIISFHAALSGKSSRMTFLPFINSSASTRFASSTSSTAS
jgi:hypothetical protein